MKKLLLTLAVIPATISLAHAVVYSTENHIYHPVVKETVVVKQPVIVKEKPAVVEEHPLDVSVAYRDDKALDLEGVEASVQYQLNDKLVLGGNLFGNEDDLLSYGAYAGVPFKLTGHSVRVIPYVGLEQYTENDQTGNVDRTAVNTGFKTFTNVYKSVGLTTDVKYVRGTEDKDNLNDVSYSIGLSHKF